MSTVNRFLLISILALLLPGCGYHLGSLMHPQVKTIAVAPVINETLAFHLAADMRSLLSEQFMVDGSLKIKDMKTADCIIYAKVTSVQFREVADATRDDGENYHANEWSVSITVEFTVTIPGKKEPLVSTRSVSGSANFQGLGDLETGRSQGVRQACYDAATKVVQYTTEAW
ncbi:MAG: LPS assembly lipoprotein LptE [Victivallaceae bacterium]|nr:LPS assembly lipoprotein LptE [Victivallaceae bacterium]